MRIDGGTALADGSLSAVGAPITKARPTLVLNSAAKLASLHTDLLNQQLARPIAEAAESANKERIDQAVSKWQAVVASEGLVLGVGN